MHAVGRHALTLRWLLSHARRSLATPTAHRQGAGGGPASASCCRLSQGVTQMHAAYVRASTAPARNGSLARVYIYDVIREVCSIYMCTDAPQHHGKLL